MILVRLLCLGEVQLEFSGSVLEKRRVYEYIQRTSNWRKIIIRQRKQLDSGKIEDARKLGQQIFGEMGPDQEQALYDFLHNKFYDWQSQINEYRVLAETGKYPGLDVIKEALRLVSLIIGKKESFEFINRFLENKDELIINCPHHQLAKR